MQKGWDFWPSQMTELPGCRVLAWPSMQNGALPVESGVHLAFAREIAAAPNPEAKRRALEEEMFTRVVNIFQKTLTGGHYNESNYPMQELWQ